MLFGVSSLVFFLLRLTGDPVLLYLPLDATLEERAIVQRQFGLDAPLYVQYGKFITGLVQGDLGSSIRTRQPALNIVLQRLPATLELAAWTMFVIVCLSVPIGVLSAIRRDTWIDSIGMTLALIGQSMPPFWLGIMMILLFSVDLHLLPTGGRGSLSHLVMPVITLGFFFIARTSRMIRSSVLDVLSLDYIRTAHAKGLASRVVVWKHILRNAMIPVLTLMGLDAGGLIGGAVITETIFAWPGIGRLVMDSIGTRDFPIVQATVLLAAAAYVVINLAVDVSYAVIDPRIRLG